MKKNSTRNIFTIAGCLIVFLGSGLNTFIAISQDIKENLIILGGLPLAYGMFLGYKVEKKNLKTDSQKINTKRRVFLLIVLLLLVMVGFIVYEIQNKLQ